MATFKTTQGKKDLLKTGSRRKMSMAEQLEKQKEGLT